MNNLGPAIKIMEIIIEGKKAVANALMPVVVADVEITQEMGDSHGNQPNTGESAPEAAAKKDTPYFGDPLQSTVIREADKGKTYERLMLDGHQEDLTPKKDQLLKILNEVQTPTYRGQPMTNKDKLEEYVFFAREEEKKERDSEQSHDGEESHDEDNEPTEVVTLKSTNPGYFKSLVSKI